MKNNISMEIIYNRKKVTVTFKGIVTKLLVSSLVLTSVLSNTTPVFASGLRDSIQEEYRSEYTITSEVSTIAELENTINEIKASINDGVITTKNLETLAKQLNKLNVSTYNASEKQTIQAVLDEAEKVVDNISTDAANSVKAEILAIKASLGASSFVVEQKKAMNTKIDVSAIQNPFTDVSKDAWYYNTVLTAYSLGLMQGQGNGIFAPQKTMTVAEFLTVSVNALYKDEVSTTQKGSQWWDVYYSIALSHGLITSNEYTREATDMNRSIPRQEMARIASRVSQAQGEAQSKVSNTSIIPDYATIPTSFRSYVQDCYAKGILNGDEAGRFNGSNSLTRAEATSAILNLVDPNRRNPRTETATPATTEKHEWRVGEAHTNLPQVGDVVIKEDGTRVTLKLGPGGVLGAGQGVDIYSGLTLNNGPIQIGKVYGVIGQTPLRKDPITGEVHTEDDWSSICNSELNPTGSYRGSYDGEIFNTWWEWDAGMNDWLWMGPN